MKTVLFQLPDTRHAINLNVLHDVLMVVVRIARYEAKVAERLTTQTCHSGLNVFQKVKHLQALFNALTVIVRTALPVRHHMKANLTLAAPLASAHQHVPVNTSEFNEYRRTLPSLFLLDKLHVVVP